jgi:hypothetical protein
MAACFATIKKHTEEENRILEFFDRVSVSSSSCNLLAGN